MRSTEGWRRARTDKVVQFSGQTFGCHSARGAPVVRLNASKTTDKTRPKRRRELPDGRLIDIRKTEPPIQKNGGPPYAERRSAQISSDRSHRIFPFLSHWRDSSSFFGVYPAFLHGEGNKKKGPIMRPFHGRTLRVALFPLGKFKYMGVYFG